jgi:HPt (histidine-containing phosphotransfer) domain-containing protein
MPRADPNASFEVAVRHLFRHLDDAEALRRNPLVSRFFGEPAETIEQIRSLVLLAAQSFRDRPAPHDEKARRARQFAIVAGCVENKSPSQLTAELCICLRQYRRERDEIQRWVASFLRSYEPSPKQRWPERISEFEFEMERAAARAETGDFNRAIHSYEEIAATADLPRKIDALCKIAEVELDLGKYPEAEVRLGELSALLAVAQAQPDLVKEPHTRVQWLWAKLALETADFDRAARLTECVSTNLAGFLDAGNRHLEAVRAEVKLELAIQATDRGEFLISQKHLDEADAICENDPSLVLRSLDLLFARINLNFSRMRPGDGQSLQDHLLLANRAMEIARQKRSLKHKLLVANQQVQLQSSPNNTARDIEGVRAIAKHFPNRRIVGLVFLMLANYLMQTRDWRMAGDLLRHSFPKRTFAWGLAMHTRAQYLLRLGDPLAADRYEKLALDGARHARNPRLCAIALLGLAKVANLSAHNTEAADYIEAAIPIAERYGSLPSCLKTYQEAAFITGKTEYARAAEKLRLAVAG